MGMILKFNTANWNNPLEKRYTLGSDMNLWDKCNTSATIGAYGFKTDEAINLVGLRIKVEESTSVSIFVYNLGATGNYNRIASGLKLDAGFNYIELPKTPIEANKVICVYFNNTKFKYNGSLGESDTYTAGKKDDYQRILPFNFVYETN